MILLGLASAASADPWEGKDREARSLRFERVVAAPVAEVFELWTTRRGVQRFFAPEARIDPRQGGLYEMIFDPEGDPEGEVAGTKGARVLIYEPPRRLAFEWRGRGYMKEMNRQPLPTWVELELAPVEGEKVQTRVVLQHRGFGSGGGWDHAFAFFEQAWPQVLERLDEACAERARRWMVSASRPGSRRAAR